MENIMAKYIPRELKFTIQGRRATTKPNPTNRSIDTFYQRVRSKNDAEIVYDGFRISFNHSTNKLMIKNALGTVATCKGSKILRSRFTALIAMAKANS